VQGSRLTDLGSEWHGALSKAMASSVVYYGSPPPDQGDVPEWKCTMKTEAELEADSARVKLKNASMESDDSPHDNESKRAHGDRIALVTKMREELRVALEKVKQQGEIAPARSGDTVICHYRFALANGIEVDSTAARKDPMTFRVGTKRILPGFEKAIPYMSTGVRLWITMPFEEAFGPAGIPGLVPPYATIHAEVHVVEVIPIELQGALHEERLKLQDLHTKELLSDDDLASAVERLRDQQREDESNARSSSARLQTRTKSTTNTRQRAFTLGEGT